MELRKRKPRPSIEDEIATEATAAAAVLTIEELSQEVVSLRSEVKDLKRDKPASRAYVHGLFSVVVIAVLVMFAMVTAQQRETDRAQAKADAREDARIQAGIEDEVDECEAQGEFRLTFRNILAQVADPPDGASPTIDFSFVEGFDRLEPDLQFFLGNLAVALAAGAGEGNEAIEAILEEYIKGFPIRNCAELRTRLEREARELKESGG